ncbi:type 1 fimbrial protein [Serratia fonticola]|uniref:fimbrial protein n=1 Tax=Serratia TaxID=613 RepID=UPI000E0EDF77|nr:type 1 fimbrial protein [Serratia fonticola]MBP1036366.1 type 1 fimbrial protein [Serratia fonticola]RDL14347.1 type 1 fimbria pilin [Serratia fonticola]CAI0836655.1 putative fimbrial protein SthA [Serratia fonticola]
MRLNRLCLKKVSLISLAMVTGLTSSTAPAVTLNFSATIMPGTCSLSLDKSVLPLDEMSQARLRSGALINSQPFTLKAGNCDGVATAGLQPMITVSGEGVTQDGKWLFRSSDSSAGGSGVMLVQSANMPNYNSTEVKPTDTYPLAAMGQIPVGKDLPFFAGISCGGSTGCATVKPGKVIARITFTFAYR